MISETLVSAEATAKLAEIETLAAKLGAAESQLESGYGSLAVLLYEVSQKLLWKAAYKNFGEFMAHLTDTYHIGHSQL